MADNPQSTLPTPAWSILNNLRKRQKSAWSSADIPSPSIAQQYNSWTLANGPDPRLAARLQNNLQNASTDSMLQRQLAKVREQQLAAQQQVPGQVTPEAAPQGAPSAPQAPVPIAMSAPTPVPAPAAVSGTPLGVPLTSGSGMAIPSLEESGVVPLNGTLAKPSWRNTPVDKWTGDMLSDYNKEMAPSQTMSNIAMGAQAANSLVNMGLGIYSMWNAGREFDFQRNMANTNLTNSIKSYNDQISDRTQNSISRTAYMRNQAEYDKRIADKQLEQKKL